jgi:hypothetical protein
MTLEELENRVRALEDIEEIKKLQRIYGFYLERWMSQQILDLFYDGPDVSLTLFNGTYLGKQGIKRFFDSIASVPAVPEFLHQVMQLSGVVDVDTDGKTAKGRWYGFGPAAIPTGKGVAQAFFNGIYEDEYVKDNGKWKFKTINYSATFGAPYDEGWVKPSRQAAIEDFPKGTDRAEPDIPATVNTIYPSGYLLPFHFKHPITGK